MLSKIRKNLRAFSLPLWIVAASFVGTIFLVWGKGSVSGPSASEVATVNGEGITVAEFNREYQSVVADLKSRFGENFRKFVKEEQIKRAALNRLVVRKLLLQVAEKEGLEVSDWAVAKHIEEIPLFQEDGKFSIELYKAFLESRHLTPQAFENTVREDLLIQKVLSVIDRAPSVSNYELSLLYREFFGRRNFRYKLFKAEDFASGVSEEEIKKFYEENTELFKGEGKESYFVLTFPKTEEGQKEAQKAYRLATEGKFDELLKLGAEPLKDKELIEKLKEKSFVFRSTDDGLILAFKAVKTSYRPLEEVKGEIEKRLRESRGLELALKAAQEYKGELPEETGEVDFPAFLQKLKPLPTENPETLFFETPKGRRVVVQVEGGYAVIEPTTGLKAGEVEKEKMERLKEMVLNARKDSDYAHLINLLRQKAVVKVNPSLFGSGQ